MVSQSQKQVSAAQVKKSYVAPELTDHGSVETKTQLSVSNGSNQTTFRLAK